MFRPVIGAAGDPELKVRDVIIRSQWLEGLIASVPDQEVSEFVKWLLHKPYAAATNSPAWIKVADVQDRLRRQTENLKELLCDKPPLYRTRLTGGMLELLAALCTASRCGQLQEAE